MTTKNERRAEQIVETAAKMEKGKPRRGRSIRRGRSRVRRPRSRTIPPPPRPRANRKATPQRNRGGLSRSYRVRAANTAYARSQMSQLLHGTALLDFVNANTHPFGPEGIGAVIPDHTDPIVSPTYDTRNVSIDLTTIFNPSGSLLASTFEGVIVSFLPRSMAAGLLAAYEEPNASEIVDTAKLSFVYVDSNFVPLIPNNVPQTGTNTQKLCILDPYYLLVIPVYSDGHSIVIFNGEAVYGAYIMRLPKTSKILDNTTALRMVGAGIKIKPRESLLNVAGIAHAGQVKIQRFTELLAQDLDAIGSEGKFKNFATNFYGEYFTERGIKGATARYDLFQNIEQLQKQQTDISPQLQSVTVTVVDLAARKKRKIKRADDFDKFLKKEGTIKPLKLKRNKSYAPWQEVKDSDSSFAFTQDESKEQVEEKMVAVEDTISDKFVETNMISYGDVDMSKNDLVDPGDYVPCVYYQFNNSSPQQLELIWAIHAVTEVKADFPFLSSSAKYDPCFNVIQNVISDPAYFPLVTRGDSFKSAISKFGAMAGKVLAFGNRAHKMLKIIEDNL
jgi:hypothetical protein